MRNGTTWWCRSSPCASAVRLGVSEGGRRAHVLVQAPGVAVRGANEPVGETSTTTDYAITSTMGTATIGSVVPLGGGSAGKRARGKRSRGAGKHSTTSAVFSSGVEPETSRSLLSDGSGTILRVGAQFEGIAAGSGDLIVERVCELGQEVPGDARSEKCPPVAFHPS